MHLECDITGGMCRISSGESLENAGRKYDAAGFLFPHDKQNPTDCGRVLGSVISDFPVYGTAVFLYEFQSGDQE